MAFEERLRVVVISCSTPLLVSKSFANNTVKILDIIFNEVSFLNKAAAACDLDSVCFY